MNTTQLECFLAVANHLNFSRAAEQLRITQPAVSHQIRTLEDELGVKLFHRTSKNVRLTPEGFQFTQYAGEILKLAGLSRTRVRDLRAATPARLGIGCRSTLELRLLLPALRAMREEERPPLPLLRLIPFDSLENLLREGDIDVMFAFQPPAGGGLRSRELARCPVVCACAPDHPLAREERLTVDRLRQAGPMAACRPPIAPPALLPLQARVMADRAPGEVLFCDQQEISLALAAAGYAFTLAVDFPSARLPGLRYIPIPELPELRFHAVYLPGEHDRSLSRFLSLLSGALAEAPGGGPEPR